MAEGWEKKLAEKAGRFVLKEEGKGLADFSLVLLSPDKMRAVNKKYRAKDCPTDVLSFEGLDILICPEVVKENAKKFAVSYKQELCRAAIHGALHFLGYDHEKTAKGAKEMREKEEQYLQEFKLKTRRLSPWALSS